MKIDPYQAEKIWLDLFYNPRKLMWPCNSTLELKNNRSALYRARDKLIAKAPTCESIKQYEVGKDDTGLNILIQPVAVGTPEADAQLHSQGIVIHEIPTTDLTTHLEKVQPDKLIISTHEMPINPDLVGVEEKEEIPIMDILNQLGEKKT